jgi:hypothetical protein
LALTFQKGDGEKIYITKLTNNDTLPLYKLSVNDRLSWKGYFAAYEIIGEDGECSIELLSGAEKYMPSDLEIPSTYRGKKVTYIHYNGFTATKFKSVIIPDSVITIRASAFSGCSSLEKIIIGKGVTFIAQQAFGNCSNLQKVYYRGTESEWNSIDITDISNGNDYLKNATRYYYSETKPTTEGNYWHYVDGEIFEWDGSACENGHTWIKLMCSTDSICSKCDAKKPALFDCTFGDLEIMKLQSCTEAGQSRRKCTVCGATKYETYGTPLGHDYGDLRIVAATCTEQGYREQVCLRCGDFKKEYTTEATGHTWSDWVLDVPTHTDHKECTVCGLAEEREHPCLYDLVDGTYHVKANGNITGVIEIPSRYDGIDVTQIAKNGFAEQGEIVTVIIPEGVTSIDARAFYGCSNLVSLVIPKSVTNVGDLIISNINSVFDTVYYCGTEEDWANVTIGETNYELEDATFYYYSETEFFWDDENYWCFVDGTPEKWLPNHRHFAYTRQDDGTYLAGYRYSDKPSKLEIPSTYKRKAVTAIGSSALNNCSNITEIVIPDTVISIGGSAFRDCINLININIPDKVKSIGNYAFYKCASLAEIEIPDSVTSMGSYVFSHCSNLTKAVIGNGVTTIEIGTFWNCSNLTNIVIPKNVTAIKVAAFYGCTNLAIEVAEGNTAFYVKDGCLIETATGKIIFGDRNSTIPTSASSIGEGAFYGKAFSAPIKIPLNIIKIESNAFGGQPVTVHVEAKTKPEDWEDDWCDDNVTVKWGYSEGGESCSHSYGGWTTTNLPTCTRFGRMQRTCSICGNVDIAMIDPLEHKYKTVVTEPTCLTKGYTDYICDDCGAQLRKDYTNSLGHEWDEGFVRIEPTCTTNGVRRHTCTRCGDTVEIGISALRHDWGAWEDVHPATCEIDGMRERICSRCGEIETETIKAVGHDWDTEVEVIEPTCTDGGYTIHTCNACGETKWDSYTEPLGHNIVNGICTRCDNDTRGVIYYGVAAIPERYNSAFVLGLDQKVPSNSHLTSINATPLEDEYIYYCAPTAFGDCAFAYNNFVGGFTLIIEGLALTNAGGKTEAYNIYKSNQANLGVNGAITITITEKG